MEQKVTIIGLGFVGLSLASFLSSRQVKVTGIDSNKKKLICYEVIFLIFLNQN